MTDIARGYCATAARLFDWRPYSAPTVDPPQSLEWVGQFLRYWVDFPRWPYRCEKRAMVEQHAGRAMSGVRR